MAFCISRYLTLIRSFGQRRCSSVLKVLHCLILTRSYSIVGKNTCGRMGKYSTYKYTL